MVALRLRFARGRSVGACVRVVFYGRPLPLKPAPVAARLAWSSSSETDTSSTATLRQQGVDKSLFVLVGVLVDTFIMTHRTRAARYKPPPPSKSPANSTPAFAGRWDFTSHKPRRDFFFHRARRILFDLSKRMGGASPVGKSANIPRRIAASLENKTIYRISNA